MAPEQFALKLRVLRVHSSRGTTLLATTMARQPSLSEG